MPFSFRVFCRESSLPSLSEIVMWMRQFESPVTICGGRSAGDLLTNFWDEVRLGYSSEPGSDAPNLGVRCLRADASGMVALRAETDDFVTDVNELEPSAARARVLDQLAATQAVVIIEFSPDGVTFDAEEAARGLMTLFADKAGGMAQRDGVGFFDEDDDVILKLG